MKKIFRHRLVTSVFMIISIMMACTDEIDEGTRPSNVDFTYTVDPENPKKITFNSTAANGSHIVWNFGDKKTATEANPTHIYAKGGNFTVVLNVRSQGGSVVVTKKISIPTEPGPDPEPEPGEVNVIKGGDMNDPTAWTVYGTGSTPTTISFDGGVLNFSNGTGSAQTNIIVFQEVTVKAGVEYTFSADVFGSGASNTWFEIYIGPNAPVDDADYSYNDYQFIALNTWAGCAIEPFEGNIMEVGCGGTANGQDGKMTFESAGTYYVVLKGGSWDGNMGADGISIDNVKLIEKPTTPVNVVKNGGMADETHWTVANAGSTVTTTEFVDGVLKFSNGNGSAQTNILVYQALTVEAGTYTFSANVSGSGATNSWFEIYLGPDAPVDGSDYSHNDYQFITLNTWAGCATSAFDGNIIEVGCGGTEKDGDGKITFESAGTIYLVIKGGSWDGNLGADGISIDNIMLVKDN